MPPPVTPWPRRNAHSPADSWTPSKNVFVTADPSRQPRPLAPRRRPQRPPAAPCLPFLILRPQYYAQPRPARPARPPRPRAAGRAVGRKRKGRGGAGSQTEHTRWRVRFLRRIPLCSPKRRCAWPWPATRCTHNNPSVGLAGPGLRPWWHSGAFGVKGVHRAVKCRARFPRCRRLSSAQLRQEGLGARLRAAHRPGRAPAESRVGYTLHTRARSSRDCLPPGRSARPTV